MKKKNAPRIVIVAPVHSWNDIRVFQKQALSLAAAGYEVFLIAQAEHSFTVSDVKIVAAPKSRSRVKRLLKLPLVFLQAIRLGADVYHLHNPDTLLIALPLKLLGRRVIYDTHEDFSKRLLMREWLPKWLRPLLAHFVSGCEALIGRLADASIATQADVRQRLGKKAILIGNPPITTGPLVESARELAKCIADQIELRLIYVGVINRSRGIEQMVDALDILDSLGVKARLWLIGAGTDSCVASALARPGGKFVDFLGSRPQAEAFAYMAKAHIGLVPILDEGDHAKTSPNKLYEYLVFGLPVIASAFATWKNSLPTGAVFITPGSAKALADSVVALDKQPSHGRELGLAGQRFVTSNYNWALEFEKLAQLYRQVLKESRHR